MATIDLAEARKITDAKEQQYGLPAGTLWKIGSIESGFNGNAVSNKGARSYFQFMEPTAKSYGVTIGDFTSEADGAARYMRDNLKKYNGNMDLSLADYNGGPKAAAALAKGKPWAETSGYLAKFYGKPHAPLSSQFTTGGEVLPNYGGPSASELARDAAQRDAQYGGVWNGITNIPSAVGLGFQVDNSVYNFWKERGLSQVDPNFLWNDDNSAQYLKDIPERHWGYILQSTSTQEADLRRARLIDTMQKEQELAKMGVVGFGGRLVGNLVDLPTLISFVPGAGGVGLLSKTSRLANALRMGALGAATNVAFDAVANQYRPTATTDDLYVSAAMGLALGAGAGFAVNPARVGGHLAAENRALQDVGIARSIEAQHAEVRDFAASTGRADFMATVDRRLADRPTIQPDYAAIDRRIADGRAGAVSDDGVAAKVRDEVAALPKKDAQQAARQVEGIPTFERTFTTTKDGLKKGPSGTASQLLEKLKADGDPLVATLASRLAEQLGDDVPVFTRGAKTRSHYNFGTNEIHLRAGAEPWVQLHEIAHSVTANRIRYGLANPDTAHGQLVKDLNDVFQQAKQAASKETFKDGKTNYYLKNLDEFVAGMYSGKSEFIDFLARTKVAQGGSVLSRVVDSIRKLLGMEPNEANALTKALGITDKLIDQPLNVKTNIITPSGRKTLNYNMEPLHEGVDADTVAAAHAAEIPTVFGWGLGLENKLGGAKAPAAVRDLASKLIGTTVGYKGHTVVKANAWDDTIKWADGWAVEMRKGTYPQFEEWFKQSGMKWHEKGEAFEQFGSKVSDYIRGIDGDYPPQVIKAGDHMRKTLAKVVDYINNPLHDEGRVKRGLTETEIRDPETGDVKLVGALEKNPNYLPRKHDINKWNAMVTNYGRDAVEGWWARAYQAGREGISDEAASKWAKWYVRTVEEAHANKSQDMLDDILRGQDKDALKHSLMVNGGYTEAEAMRIIDDMLPTKATDTGRVQANLKHRNTIDETYSEQWTKADGEKFDVALSDFVYSNAFDVVEPYLRRTAGNVALAKHLDIYKNTDIDRAIIDATTNKLGADFKPTHNVQGLRKDLQFAFDRIRAMPQEEFSGLNKGMEMWRNFNVIRLMGGAVWNQATEFSQIVGSMGWKTTMAAVPELRALRRDIATGKAPHDILDHLENTIGGVGSEFIARMDFKTSDDWVRYKGDTAYNRRLDQLDAGMKKVAKGVLDYTGMNPLMIQQKRVHAVALVNHFVNTANGAESRFLTKDRLAWMGLSEEDFGKLKADLKTYTKLIKGEFSQTYKMDFEGWSKNSPETYSKFMTAIHRESRRVVQENDLPSMIPLMGTTLGKTVFQFMNFTLHGWNKSLMFSANHRDWTTLSTVLHGGLFASLAYMGRTLMDAQGKDPEKRQDFLDKRLAPGQIVANSFGRIAQASMIPNIYDTISPYPLFSGMRTTSDLSSLASNPTYQALNGLISMKKLIRNGLSDEYQTTEKDIRTWGKLLPLNNIMPISTLLNAIANDYPSSEKSQ